MTKQKHIEITDEILAQIEQVTSTTVLAEDIVVFEAAAFSTAPLSKPGSIFHGARASRALLEEMMNALNLNEQAIPIHTMHMQSIELPVGRAFHASIRDEPNGDAILIVMFYLPKDDPLVAKINLSVLDEVSVGVKPVSGLCSKCGFDYFGADADFEHLYSQTCENDHVLGQDGTHLKLVGLDRWMELSLVSRGASNKPKILSRTKQLLEQGDYDRIAASGKPVEAMVLFTSTNMEIPEMPTDITPVLEALTVLTTKVDAMEAKLNAEPAAPVVVEPVVPAVVEADTAAVDALNAQLAAANAQIADLEAAAAAAAAKEPAVIEPVVAPADLPVGGLAASAITDAKGMTPVPTGPSAFKTNRKR